MIHFPGHKIPSSMINNEKESFQKASEIVAVHEHQNQHKLPVSMMEQHELPTEDDKHIQVETVLSDENMNFSSNNATNDQDADRSDESRPRDRIERMVGFIVNLALYFFTFLAIGTMIMIAIFLVQFGVLVMVVVFTLTALLLGLGYFLDRVLQEDANWKPVQSRIQIFKVLATNALFQEVRHFQRDWNAHLLLTDGTLQNNDDDILHDDNDVNTFVRLDDVASPAKRSKGNRGKGSGKSVIFQFVKPILKLRKLGRRNKDKKEACTEIEVPQSYNPPMV
jgi:hypothetical protein